MNVVSNRMQIKDDNVSVKDDDVAIIKHLGSSKETNIVHIPLFYRLSFYLGGIVFAIISYIAGVWAFSRESTSWGLAVFTGDPIDHVQAHILSFFVWTVICIGMSVVIGALFQKEFKHRLEAEKLANLDGLTGLYNHAFFQKRLDEELERATRYDRQLSVIMLDIDNFKAFNDTWGHQEGDRLLRWFSSVLATSVRNHDIVSRYGGEEFIAILPETNTHDAMIVSQRIVETAKKLSSASMGKGRGVTASAGIATFPTHGMTKSVLLSNADTALYSAKTSGKNRSVASSSDNIIFSEKKRPYSRMAYRTAENSATLLNLADITGRWMGFTHDHSQNIEHYSLLLGQSIGLSAKELDNLRMAALLHDVGNICIPDSILTKSEPLTPDDWKLIHEHVQIGANIIKKAGQSSSIIPGVKHHHEHFDGSGYPDGLAGKDIPLAARIISITDAYEAMTNPRPYRKQMSAQHALNEIQRCSESQFDPELTQAFSEIMSRTKNN